MRRTTRRRLLLGAIGALVALCLLSPPWTRGTGASTAYHLEEPSCKTLEVTYIDGSTEKIAGVRFDFPGGHHYLRDHESYLPIQDSGSPPRMSLVHHAKIAQATFATAADELAVDVLLDGGEHVAGKFPVPDLEILGSSELGMVRVKVTRVKSLRFLEFATGLLREGPTMSRAQAAAKWSAVMKGSPFRWIIVDGSKTMTGGGFLGILDSYSVVLVSPSVAAPGRMRYAGTGMSSDIRSDVKARDAIRERDLELPRLQGVDITGKLEEGGALEAVITTTEGARQTVSLTSQVDDSNKAGPVGELDFLVWGKPYGFECTPLLPGRRIVVTREAPAKPTGPVPIKQAAAAGVSGAW